MSAACGWNGCTASGDPDMDGRCEEHEFSQCRTEGCTGDAADGDGWDGFCRDHGSRGNAGPDGPWNWD